MMNLGRQPQLSPGRRTNRVKLRLRSPSRSTAVTRRVATEVLHLAARRGGVVIHKLGAATSNA
jgi:hypothetical protein